MLTPLTRLYIDLIKYRSGHITMDTIRQNYKNGDYGKNREYITWAVKRETKEGR